MAIAKTPVTVLASQSISAGGTKAAPSITPTVVDCRTYYGGLLTVIVTNGASAPGAAIQLQTQVSADGTNWRDFGAPMAGDTTASSTYSWSFEIPRAAMYLRVVPYANTTNAVTVAAELEAVTGL